MSGSGRRAVLAAVAIAATAALGCSDPTGRPLGGEVTVRGEGGFVRISSARAEHVYYFLVERETAAVVDWQPCTLHREVCDHVHAGETISIPYAEVPGWEAGDDEAILFWWHLVEVDGSLRADEVRSITFALR